jgi:hypothetical protein
MGPLFLQQVIKGTCQILRRLIAHQATDLFASLEHDHNGSAEYVVLPSQILASLSSHVHTDELDLSLVLLLHLVHDGVKFLTDRSSILPEIKQAGSLSHIKLPAARRCGVDIYPSGDDNQGQDQQSVFHSWLLSHSLFTILNLPPVPSGRRTVPGCQAGRQCYGRQCSG